MVGKRMQSRGECFYDKLREMRESIKELIIASKVNLRIKTQVIAIKPMVIKAELCTFARINFMN